MSRTLNDIITDVARNEFLNWNFEDLCSAYCEIGRINDFINEYKEVAECSNQSAQDACTEIVNDIEKTFPKLEDRFFQELAAMNIGFGEDPIFLLSEETIRKYSSSCSFSKEAFKSLENEQTWTRNLESTTQARFYYDGLFYTENIGDVYIGITPALDIRKVSKYTFLDEEEEIILCCGRKWYKFAENFYIVENTIATNSFDDGDEVVCYRDSDIREKLLAWYEERKNW